LASAEVMEDMEEERWFAGEGCWRRMERGVRGGFIEEEWGGVLQERGGGEKEREGGQKGEQR